VGAAFDFHTGRLAQAPRWMQRSGLEWFYRLYKEPRRLWKRYIEIVPKFAILAGVDLIKHYLRKRT
jgi:N-acetylglucosaminyldiphosphoundecaprenol N-acetyl-beta-D-mannosaminyltransferase